MDLKDNQMHRSAQFHVNPCSMCLTLSRPPHHPTSYLLQAVAQLLQLPEGGRLAQPAPLPSALPLTCHFVLSMSVQRILIQRIPPWLAGQATQP